MLFQLIFNILAGYKSGLQISLYLVPKVFIFTWKAYANEREQHPLVWSRGIILCDLLCGNWEEVQLIFVDLCKKFIDLSF